MNVLPITGALGAEVTGIQLGESISDQTFAQIHEAFLEHCVLCFRDQDLTPQKLLSFGRRFGEVHRHPYIEGLEECPEVIEILRRPEDTHAFGKLWHTDQIFYEIPPSATFLYALEVPEVGGDTVFANTYRAYEALSEGMQELLRGLKTYNVGDGFKQLGGRSRAERYKGRSSMKLKATGKGQFAEHPLVRRHPETGRDALYFGFHTQRFANMTEAESEPLLRFLAEHVAKPEFGCRVRWRPKTLTIWDNRCTQHIAVDDYFGHRRRMHRLTVRGDGPVGFATS